MKLFISFGIFFLFSIFSFSQSIINGKLKTLEGVPISGVSVTIRLLNTDNILDYNISNDKGEFVISVDTKITKIQLKIRSMGYKTVVKTIDNKTQTLDFIFFDIDDFETFRVTETIPSGSLTGPSIKTFSVELNAQQIDIITSSIRAEVSVNQPGAATNLGEMEIECIVEAGYLYPGE